MGRKAHPLAARIKKMMQTDEDVGKIAQATPVMIGWTLCSSSCTSHDGLTPELALHLISVRSSCHGALLAEVVLQFGGGGSQQKG